MHEAQEKKNNNKTKRKECNKMKFITSEGEKIAWIMNNNMAYFNLPRAQLSIRIMRMNLIKN